MYWRDEIADHIYRCPLSGCGTPEIIASDIVGGEHAALALDEHYIYWTTATRLMRRAK